MRRFAAVFAAALALADGAARAQQPPRDKPEPERAFEEGAAARGSGAGWSGVAVRPGLEVIAAYDLHVARESSGGYAWFHQFELTRADASLEAQAGPAIGRIDLEAVRSASEGALLGVDGDSLVMRVREASAGVRAWGWLQAAIGVVPTLTVPELDGTFAARAVAATPLESTGLGVPADLGATARVVLPGRFGWFGAGVYDGEGYAQRELNRGKNLELAAELHPFAGVRIVAPTAFASAEIGSEGTGSSRAHRGTLGLFWQGVRIRAGAAFTYAWGLDGDGARRSWLVDAFARTEPLDRLILAVRGFWWARDVDVAKNAVGEGTGAVGYRIAPPLELFLSVTRTFPESRAAASLPDLDSWDGRVVGHVFF